MEIKVEVPEYNKENGLQYNWQNGFEIKVMNENGMIIISANKAGLVSLANHLLNLAQNQVPIGHHLHFDKFNSLEEDSLELTIQKVV